MSTNSLLAAADITHISSLSICLYLHFKPQFCPYWILSQTEEPAKVGTCAHDRRALQQLALNVHVKHSWPDLTWPDPTESCPRQRNRRRSVPVPMTGVRYNSLLWTCTLNTLTRPDLIWPDPTESCPGQRNQRSPVPVPMTGVHYNSLLWMCTLNTLTRPDLTWPYRITPNTGMVSIAQQ